MITAPHKAKFLVPSAQFDATAEPTLEGLAGTDAQSTAISDGDQAINTMDGNPHHLLTATTNSVATTWQIDAELNKRATFDFAMLDSHNLLQVYPSAIRSALKIMAHTSDTVGSATEVTASKIYSGLLGEVRPSLHFDERNDYVTMGDDDDFKPGYGDLTVEWYGYINPTSASTNLIHKGTPSGGRMLLQVKGTGQARWSIEDDSNNPKNADGTSQIITGEIVHIFGVTDRSSATGHKLYVDSGDAQDTKDPTGVTDVITGAGNPFVLGTRSSAPGTGDNFGGEMIFCRYYNRALSDSEVAAKIADPFGALSDADKYGKMLELMPTDANRLFDAGGGGTEWANVDLFAFSDNGDLSLEAGGGGQYCTLPVNEAPMTAGYRYRLQFDVNNLIALWDIKDFTGAQTFGSVSGDGNNQWIEFTVDEGITGGLRVVAVLGVSTADFDNFSLIRVGCVASYDPDGISDDQNKWLDASTNDLDGTITGPEYRNVPVDGNEGFYYEEFTDVVDNLFWFFQFNTDGETGLANTELGQIALGKIYEFQIRGDGYEPTPQFPGISTTTSDSGRVYAEEFYGRRDAWSIEYTPMTEAQFTDYQTMLDFVKGDKFPLYVIFNDDDAQPIIHRIRFDGPPKAKYVKGASRWMVSQKIIQDI